MIDDAYEVIMFRQSLYPHEIGDQLLSEIMEATNDREATSIG